MISEPGRFYVTESGTLAANVIARRAQYSNDKEDEEDEVEEDSSFDGQKKREPSSYMYYLSDGVYGTFNAIVWDSMAPTPFRLPIPGPGGAEARNKYPSTMFGPTCDSIDVSFFLHFFTTQITCTCKSILLSQVVCKNLNVIPLEAFSILFSTFVSESI